MGDKRKMNIEEVIPKNHKKIDVKKEKGTLFNYLTSLEGDFGFDVSDCNYENCYCGDKKDAQGFLNNVLHRTYCNDVEVCYKYYSDIAETEWYKIILNIDIEKLRGRREIKEND